MVCKQINQVDWPPSGSDVTDPHVMLHAKPLQKKASVYSVIANHVVKLRGHSDNVPSA